MANINAQFNYSANFGPVIGQMQKLTAEANLLNNTLQNLDKQSVGLKSNLAGAFASDLGKIGGYNAKMIQLTDSVDQFGQSLLKQKLTLKEYAKEAIGAFTSSSNAHKLAVREVAREMSQLVTLGKGMDGKQMGMMITPATINLKDFNTQLAVSQKQWSIFNSLVQDGTTHLINFGKNTQWAGRQITVGLTVPLTIYGNAVSKIFREVDAELTRFQKVYGSDLMNSTSESTKSMVDDVRNLAIEFSKSFGIAAKETASLAADLAATGLEGQKLLASLRETTRLAVLGDVSNQDAMKTTLSLQNAFKISTDELASSVNFLNAVENQTSLSLQDLTTAIPKAGPVVKALGGDVKDLSLLMVALKEGGISAAEGANALKSGMASLINPTKQASITAKQYGIDINAIVQANRGQLMPTIIAFQQQLQLLDDFGKAQVIENVFGKYQFARISALFDNLNASASQTNAVLGLMGKSNKELAATAYQEMDTLMNSSSKRFQRAIEGIKAQFISIGGSITASITPILENVTSKIAKAIEFFQNLPKPVKSFIKVATGLTAIAGPIIMMVGIFSNFLGYIGKGAMGMVNLGRRMAGIPTQKFEMLTDTQIMATKATEQLSMSFDRERSSVERLNQALGIYRQNLVDAISLNPAFVNRQMPSLPASSPTAQMQRGGSAWVPGSGDGDKVPAMLEPGEYVVNKKAAAKYSGTLDQINYQSAPRFQKGGRMPGYADTSTTFNYDATYPGDRFKLDQSKHLVLANGKVMLKADYDRISSQGGRLPVLMRDDMNPYLNEKYEPSLRYRLGNENPFVGPLPQVSYQAMGRAGVGGSRNVYGYPFKTEQEAGVFSTLNSTTFGANQGGSKTSNIARSINDPQQQAYADWIAGHNTNQFRAGTGVMKRLQMEGHREQMLNSMSPISQSIPLFRGTVLKEKGANEFSGVGARELLMYIKHGMFDKAMGKKIQWSDMQSFSTIPDIANYSKFIESWTNPSNTNSKKAADRQLASMEMLPVIFRLASARGQTGFNISDKAIIQEVMGSPVDEKEWVLNNPSGTITGIRQDIGTKNYIIDLMQKGGRVQSAAGGLTEEQKQQALFDYTDMSRQNKEFEGFGRGSHYKKINFDSLYRNDPLQNALDVLLPNAKGASEEEQYQLSVLRRYMKMFNITDASQLTPGMQASLNEMFMVHRSGDSRMLMDPSRIKPMEIADLGYTLQEEGPGTYFSPSLKVSDEAWDDYAGSMVFKMSKTREAFRGVARSKGYLDANNRKEIDRLTTNFSRTKAAKQDGYEFDRNSWVRDPAYAARNSGVNDPFIQSLISKGYQGINFGGSVITNWNIGRPGIGLSPISNPLIDFIYDNDKEDYVDLKKPYQANIPNLSPVGYQSGGRVNGYADESLMPEKYSKKMEGIQSIMDATSQEATGGMYAGMPMTDIGNLVDRIGGRSAAIPGASGIYEQGGVRSVVKGHNTATSARIEAIASALTRSIFGLESPVQEFIKFAHPETSSAMFGVRSPFDEKFAKTSGKISPDKFFMQALSAIIRGDSDLQPDNLYDGIVVDQGAGYGSDRASQPRGLTGKKFSVGDQAKVNFLMQKGGARRWFTEATAGIAQGMTREQYVAGFMQAISTAQANFPAAMASLAGMNLTKEEQQIFGVLAGDLQAAQGIDWGSIYDSHLGVTPEVKKPPTEAAAAKALLTKQANKEEYEKATAAGYPSWMGYALGGRVNGYATKTGNFQIDPRSLIEKNSKGEKLWDPRYLYGSTPGENRFLNEANQNKQVRDILLDKIAKSGKSKSSIAEMSAMVKANRNSFSLPVQRDFSQVLEAMYSGGGFNNWSGKEDLMGHLFAAIVAPQYRTSPPIPLSQIDPTLKPDYADKFTNVKGSKQFKDARTKSFLGSMGFTSQGQASTAIRAITNATLSKYGLKRNLSDNIFNSLGGSSSYGMADAAHSLVLAQMGGRINGYATETTSWAKKAAAPKAYAGVLQGIPNWATKANEYNAIVSALQNAGVPQSDRLASFYIQDVLAHINPSTTNANGIYEKVWSAANLMKDSQVYNVFLETLRTRKDIGGLLNPSTVSRVAAASGLPMPVVQAELTKIADGVHPNTANGAKVMMTLARMFPSRTSPGMPIAVAAGMGARLQGNFYDTLGQRALPSSLPNTTVRAYDPKGTGAPTSTTQGSRTASSGIVMPSGAIRPGMVMPNIQSIPSAAGGTGTSATVKVDGMGNVLSNGIDDMVANTIMGQPIAVSSKELLAIGPNGGIAGVTSPGDEARGKIVHPMGTALMRGGKFQQKRLRGFAVTTQDFGVEGGSIGPATREQAAQQAQNTEPVFQGQIASGRMDKFAASIGFLTSGVYTLQTAFQQFTATTADGADKFTKMAAASTLAITGIQGVSQMLVDNGKIQAMQDKAAMMQAPGASKMSSGMGKMLGAGSKALGFLGGPMGMIATSVLIAGVNKGIDMYQKAVKQAKDAGRAMFAQPIEGAKLLGITLKDTTEQAKTYAKIAKDLGMSSAGKGGYDKVYADVVKKDFGPLIDSLKLVLNAEEKRNKLALTYVSLQQQGFNAEDAKAYTQEIARQSGAMAAFNQLNLESLKTSKDIANQVVASTRAIIASVGTVDSSLLGKYINKETGTIYDTESQANASDTSIGDRNVQQITTDTAKTLSAGMLGNLDLNLTEKQLGEAIGGAFKLAYQIAANDPAAANAATALLIGDLKNGSDDLKNAANEAISQAFLDAGGSKGDLAYSFLAGGGLTDIASKFGNEAAAAIQMAVQSGNIDIVNTLLGGDMSQATIDKFKNDYAKLEALAKIDLEVDIQLNQTKVQLEEMKTEIGKVFDVAVAAKEKETEVENKRHEQALKNLDREAQRINDKKKALQENTDYYLKQLERESKAEDFYANQRQTALTGLKAASEGDIFGLIGAQMQAATQGDQFGRDRALETINDTSDLAQKKLDDELANIDARKASETERHEAELANIQLEIEWLAKKRATSIGLINTAMEAVDKAIALGSSDPGYQKAVEEAVALGVKAGMGAEQVMSYFDTPGAREGMSKEDLDALDKAQTELKTKVSAFQTDAVTAISVFEKANEIATNVFKSLAIDTTTLEGLKTFQEIVDAMNTTPPTTPNTGGGGTTLPPVDTGSKPDAITGQGGASGSTPSMVNDPNVRFKPATSMAGVVIPGTAYQKDPDNPDIAWFWDGKAGKWGSSVPTKSLPFVLFGYRTAQKKASGGMLSGPGTGTSDSIPIMASNGEYIFRADVVKRIGKAKLDQINSGNFAYGGMVGSMPGMSSAPGMATGGFVGSMPSYSSAPGMAAGGFIGNSAPSTPTYNVPSAGGGMSPSPIAQMARGGMVGGSSTMNSNAPTQNFHFSGAGMDMVMHHVNKAIGGRISSNSRRIG